MFWRRRQIQQQRNAHAVLRYGVARLECWMRGKPVPPTLVIVPLQPATRRDAIRATIANMKAEIGALVTERRNLGAVMPPTNTEWGNASLWSMRDEIHPWNRQGLIDDATLANDSVPTSVRQGSRLNMRMSAFNAGTTSWTTPEQYQLEIDPRLNVAPVPLPATVDPGATCVFIFSVPAPATTLDNFVCQMSHAGTRFGETSDPVRIVVTQLGEPPRCIQIRREIATLNARIANLQDQIDDPQNSARIRVQIVGLRRQISTLRTEAHQLACSV